MTLEDVLKNLVNTDNNKDNKEVLRDKKKAKSLESLLGFSP